MDNNGKILVTMKMPKPQVPTKFSFCLKNTGAHNPFSVSNRFDLRSTSHCKPIPNSAMIPKITDKTAARLKADVRNQSLVDKYMWTKRKY